MNGIRLAARELNFELAQIERLLHGTTIATNAVLEHKLAHAAFVTTAGFRDVLEIGRHLRQQLYAPVAEPRRVLIERAMRFEVKERIDAQGQVIEPLSRQSVRDVAARIKSRGAEAVAVCLLHAYANGNHEREVGELLRDELGMDSISLSHQLSPEVREFERASTVALNALLMPIVRGYLKRLQARMSAAQFSPALYIVQSNGGVTSPAQAGLEPARLLLSGPSGGARAAEVLGEALGETELIATDMGGTSFDVSLIQGSRARQIPQGTIDGCPVRLPMIEIRAIGAGGGSIARVEPSGRFQVGPQSAGATPGPVAYGNGGSEVTVTDANLVLGRIDPKYFLGGAVELDLDSAHRAIASRLSETLQMSVARAAQGVVKVTVANMAAAIRLSLYEKGLDPKMFALFPFGGAGGLHAAEVADELGIRRVIFPRNAGTLSAYGMLFADVVQNYAISQLLSADVDALNLVSQHTKTLLAKGQAGLSQEGFNQDSMSFELGADMRYPGQAFEVMVPWPGLSTDRAALVEAVARFHQLHEDAFAHCEPAQVPEIVTLRLTAIGRLSSPRIGGSHAIAKRAVGSREVFIGDGPQTVRVIPRDAVIDCGEQSGPVIVEDEHTTAYIPAGWRIKAGPLDALIAFRPEGTSMSELNSSLLNSIELEIIRNALVAAAEEMSVTVWRTSRSAVVREILDYSTCVFDDEGKSVAQAARIPVHLNSMSACLEDLLCDALPIEQWQAGDVVLTNDPYSGGQHLSDWLAFAPVFVAGQRVAIVGIIVHHLDVGGGAPGSYDPRATEIFQEGIRVPAMKVIRAGERNEDVVRLLMHNTREPDKVLGDFNSQLAALATGAQRVEVIARRYGNDVLRAASRAIRAQSETAARTAIAQIPSGTYEFVDWVDDDGIDADPIELRVSLTVKADSVEVDLSNCAEQVRGPVNCTYNMTQSAVVCGVLTSLGGEIAANAGAYEPIKIIAPEGLVVNARFPAPVANRMAVGHRLVNAIMGAFAQAIPNRVPASYYGVSYTYSLDARDENGRGGVYFDIEVGGWGAHPDADGASAFSCGLHNLANSPMEMIEQSYPVRFTQYALLCDSGGAGRTRGGLGLCREFELEAAEGRFAANLDRFKVAPYGLRGGGSGSLSSLEHFCAERRVWQAVASKYQGLVLRKGDRIRLCTSGGGGHGEPASREPAAVAADVAQGYVSREQAMVLYDKRDTDLRSD